MIQASISILQSSSFFDSFYHKSIQLLLNNRYVQNKSSFVHFLSQQEPILIVAAGVYGHAIQEVASHSSDDKHDMIVACASVSTLCKVMSAVLGYNIAGAVSLRAESEGEFEYTIDYQAIIDSVSLHNVHHYIEVFGVMKGFIVGMQLIAKNYPSALQCTIDMV